MAREKIELRQGAAALGVILSLLFVGFEIRQNTRVARAGAVQATMDQIIQWRSEHSTDPEWIRLVTFLEGGGSFTELSPEDRTRFAWTATSTVSMTENRFRQMQMGVISQEDLGAGGGTSNTAWFRAPYFLDWWKSRDRDRMWASDFLEFFETEVLDIR